LSPPSLFAPLSTEYMSSADFGEAHALLDSLINEEVRDSRLGVVGLWARSTVVVDVDEEYRDEGLAVLALRCGLALG